MLGLVHCEFWQSRLLALVESMLAHPVHHRMLRHRAALPRGSLSAIKQRPIDAGSQRKAIFQAFVMLRQPASQNLADAVDCPACPQISAQTRFKARVHRNVNTSIHLYV